MSANQLNLTAQSIKALNLSPVEGIRAYIKANPLSLTMNDMEKLFDLLEA